MNPKLKRFDPAVDKRLLIALSGILWILVGIMLCTLAITWLSKVPAEKGILTGLAGIILSLLIHHFGFLKLVDKNIDRILSKEGKACIFAFQAWKSYLIITIMIVMGTILRHSQLPRHYLSAVYLGFGGAMILSSIRYVRVFIKLILNPSEP